MPCPAPERTTALLAKFRNWAMGAVPQAQRKASVAHQGADVGPVDWLLARGLLVPLDAAHVELPHSVGLSLRGGAIINDFTLSPPVPELGSTTAALRRNAALGAIAETLRLVGELLHAVRAQPLATLRSGGVGVREMKRLAETLRIDQHRAGLLLELSALSGLLRLDVDSSSWVQPPQLEWLVLTRQEQWLWLVNAWLASERVPSLVGQPVTGPAGASAAHRALAGTTVNALSAEAQRPDAPVVRKRILEILNELTREAGAADGTAPVLDAAAVLQRAEWAQPRMARRFSSLIKGVLAEAELLGLIGSGALSQLGSAIADDNPEEALGILGEHLPAALNHVLLQADLTAVAPGYLAPELSEKLQLMADAEGQGPATIYRFSPTSIRRALDAGHDAASLLAFLREHSATAVPQPLEYLVEDTATRHGRLRVGTAASFIQSDDEAAVLELAAETRAAGPGAGPHRTHSADLHRPAARNCPGPAWPWPLPLGGGIRSPQWSGFGAPPAPPAAPGPSTRRRGPRPPEDDVEAQLTVLRNGRGATNGSHPGTVSGSGEAATQLGLETLQRAIRLKQPVSMSVVDSQGNPAWRPLFPSPWAVAGSGSLIRPRKPNACSPSTALSISKPQRTCASEGLPRVNDGPLIVQSDKTILLEVDHELATEARHAIAPFAELERAPEHMHSYRLTPLGLWNARAAGLDAEKVLDTLLKYSRFPVPHSLLIDVEETMSRYGRLRLEKDPQHGLVMRTDDYPVLEEVIRAKKIQPLLGPRIDGETIVVHSSQRGQLKQLLLKIGWPAEDLAGYVDGTPHLIALNEDGWKLRPYQQLATENFWAGGSGVVVLPCGAGKTLVGAAAMATSSTTTLILVTNTVAARQWKDELLKRTSLTEDEIGEYSGAVKEVRPVTIATYQVLTTKRGGLYPHLELVDGHDWGLIIYDEVHLLPAPIFRMTADLQARRRLGLTATLVREDGREGEVFSLIGPKRYDAPWKDIESQGYIAPADCVEVRVDLPRDERVAYAMAEDADKYRLCSTSESKTLIVEQLVARHQGEQLLVIGQYIDQLDEIGERLEAPVIKGDTSVKERQKLFDAFRAGDVHTLVVSKVANFSIDLPEASVAIQVSGSFGSRQEEAQRLGRLLRPKKDGRAARFYSLVARDTLDQDFAAKRQRFLAEQGYAYRIMDAKDVGAA